VTVRVHRLERRQRLNRSPDEVFSVFARAHNLEQITPPWLRFEVRATEPAEMGELAHPLLVKPDLERIFDYRHAAVARRLAP
jgi:hypothetical protein